MNKVIKSNVIVNNNILNLSQKVDSEVQIQTPRWIYQLHKSNKLHYDRERLQRLLTHWPELKANSYLTTLFNGLSQKDTIQLARIDTIAEKLLSGEYSRGTIIEVGLKKGELTYTSKTETTVK